MSTPRADAGMGIDAKTLLAQRIRLKRAELAAWHDEQLHRAPPPFYCSIDLRDAGYKIAPVDSNLYPAGFNNICPEDLRTAGPIVRAELESIARRLGHGQPRRVLILPESHTQNLYYLENLHYLSQIIADSGLEVRLGWYGAAEGTDPKAPIALTSATGKQLQAFPLEIRAGVVSAGDFVPDVLLLNNDFSGGYPEALDAVTQPIIPSHTLGWHSRRKSEHFAFYNELAAEFAAILEVDPWFIQIDTEEVAPVNFNDEQGIDEVAAAAERILSRTRQAYEAHKVARKPFVFIKNNAGTYGMGIMVAHASEELHQLNRRAKNKMSVGKNRMLIQSVAVQEGIPTATLVDRLPAEPVIYLVGGELIGGFLRTNPERGEEENLNSQGMVFRKLCMSDLRAIEEPASGEPVLELVYGAIARISALATGRELARHASLRP
ncbi:MAG: glutamate--cysteine ligase [Oligoflexia bacterium]|nr:glutamate--cysteine ligase [Oligoflexia bacterium]